jgi:hypothetical protein
MRARLRFALRSVMRSWPPWSTPGQRDRFRGSLSQRTNRPELVERFGYDTKFAYHAIRLGIQGIELMATDRIELPMSDTNREWLLAVRRGEVSRGEVDHVLDGVHARRGQAIEASRLPEQADWPAVSAFCTHVYRQWWRETGQ